MRFEPVGPGERVVRLGTFREVRHMREPSIDPERLAALLDGRLSDDEREALLADLARSEDAMEALGDAAAVLRELEQAGDVPTEEALADVAPPGVVRLAPPGGATEPPRDPAARVAAGDPEPREV